jgi:hypothetical protein
MSRQLTFLLCTLALVAGCSRNPERSLAASPTAPSAAAGLPPGSLLGASSVAPGGVSGPMDVAFPGRNDSFQFRNELEAIYRDILRRDTSPTVVDREGEVVWTQEYIRYRVNGCDHSTAVQRVLAQIAGQAAGGVCGAPPDGLVLFPGRADSFLFRGTLESAYLAMGRGQSPTFVDTEGGVIWTQEYLRYRVNACDHATAVAKVASQIAGGGVSATCFVPPCVFSLSAGSQSVPAAGGTFTVTVNKVSGDCSFGAESLGSFVSITNGGSGSATGTLTYTVAPNSGPPRSTQIRVRWPNNSILLEINQAGSALNVSILLVDPAQSTQPTSVCQIKTPATRCQLIANATLSATSTFAWTVTYNYGVVITKTQSNTSNQFTFTEQCGGSGSTAAGTDTPMNVSVTVTDPNNGTETATSVFTIKLFTC